MEWKRKSKRVRQVQKEQKHKEPKGLRKVLGPTKWEKEMHQLTHLPYRPWCEECVAGKGHSKHHQKVIREEQEMAPTVSMGYGFIRPSGGDDDEEAMGDLELICEFAVYLNCLI